MTARKGRFERRLSRHISILDRSRKTKTNSTWVQRSCPKLVHHPKRRLFCAKNGRERKEYWFSRAGWQKATSFLRRWPSPSALRSRERKLFLNWTARIFRYQLEQFSEQKKPSTIRSEADRSSSREDRTWHMRAKHALSFQSQVNICSRLDWPQRRSICWYNKPW